MLRSRGWLRAAVAVAALTLVAGACGSSSKSSDSSASYTITGKVTTLSSGPVSSANFKAQGITITPIAPATVNPTGGIDFPVTGGSLKQSTLGGTIKQSGGATFTAASGKKLVFMNPVVDTVSGIISATVEGNLNAVMVSNLSAGAKPGTNQIVIAGDTTTLVPTFAILANDSLGVDAFNSKMPLGPVTIDATYTTS